MLRHEQSAWRRRWRTFAGIRTQRVTNSQRRDRDRFHSRNAAQAEPTAEQPRDIPALSADRNTGRRRWHVDRGERVCPARPSWLHAEQLFARLWFRAASAVALAEPALGSSRTPLLPGWWGARGPVLAADARIPEPAVRRRSFTTSAGNFATKASAYRYPSGTLALDDVSSVLAWGDSRDCWALGSGNSTLAEIVLRLRAPSLAV